MSDEPLVSVIAICYNHAAFLAECLDSVDAQTYSKFELIIADDASTDGSQGLIRAWAENRGVGPTLILHDTNRGLCATLNEALAVASGRYIAYISTDDVMEPEKLENQVAIMEAKGDSVAVVYSDAIVIDEQSRPQPPTFGARFWWFDSPPEGQVFDELLRLNFIPAVSALVRRSALESIGGYDESLDFEDWDTWLRLADRFEFSFSPYINAQHRFLDSSLYHSRRVDMADSKIRLLQKWLHDETRRSRVIGRIRQEVHYIYSVDRRAALPGLRLLVELNGGMAARGRYLLARLGMNYSTQQRLAQLGRALTSPLRR